MPPGELDTARGTGSTWTRPGALLAAAFLAVAAVVGTVVATRGGDGAADGLAGPSAGNPVAAPPSGPDGGASVGGEDGAVPTAAPSAVRWELYATVAVPFSPAGPRQVEGDVATGYAHTPTGALVASQQISARKALAVDWRAVVDASVAPGLGRDAWVALRAGYGRLDPPQPGQLGQTAGFRFVDYSPERAVIQTVSRFASGTLQVTTYTVAWSGRDWRLVLQPDGSDSPTGQRVGSLAGFVAWGGV